MKFYKKLGGFLLMVWSLAACVEPYDPPVDDRDVNYLVVDGFLNVSKAEATVNLTRTLPVESTDPIPDVTGATVWIEDDLGNAYWLQGGSDGTYTGPVDNAGTERLYRLLITTPDQHEYQSDFTNAMASPPIDSITYSVSDDGVQFAVNTHDPSNSAHFYRWKFLETFEYHANFNSVYMFQGDEIVYRPFDQSVYTCWRTNASTEILVGSTKRLNESVVSHFPVSFIPKGSMKLSVEYSLLVQQQVLTEEAYEYWSKLEKSTEHLGGLFDPLPSEVSGNIHCTTNPEETVIGFFSGSTIREARTFLKRRELPREVIRFFTNDDPSCALDTIPIADVPTLSRSSWIVDAIFAPGVGITAYMTARASCVDCKGQGGTTVKPDFWK